MFPPKLPLSSNIVDDVLVIFFFHENFAPSNKLSWRKVRFLFLCCDVKKRNHLCFSLMQLHNNLNMKIQCNVFLSQVLITRRQFQRLKYSDIYLFSNPKIVSNILWMIFVSIRCSAPINLVNNPVNLHNSADNIGNWRIEGKLLLFGVVRNPDTKPLLHFFGVVRTIFFTTFIWKIICRAAHLWTG